MDARIVSNQVINSLQISVLKQVFYKHKDNKE